MIEATHKPPVGPVSALPETPSGVLVVDDEEYVLNAVERILRMGGMRVFKARRGAEALELLACNAEGVQVVMSDLHMPGMDGIQLLERVRAADAKVQRILLTANTSEREMLRAINVAGVHRFITKPWNTQALIQTVANCLDQWRVVEERDRLIELTEQQNVRLVSWNAELEAEVQRRTGDLEQATQAWRNTFDAIADPLTLVSRELRIVRANLAAAAEAGQHITRLIGRPCHSALFRRPTPCLGCPIVAGIDPREPHVSAQIEDEREGRIFRVSMWRVGEGEIRAAGADATVCHYRDITREVESRHLEKMAAVGELAGVVAHELNNPLTGVLTFSQILGRLVADRDEDLHELSGDIECAARRCRTIVQKLLDFARPSAGPKAIGPVDLTAVLTSSLKLGTLRDSSPECFEVKTEIAPDLWPVKGNGDALQSVFLNLITNAVQAMGGVGRLGIIARNMPEQRGIRVEVTDSGPGIPKEMRAKIFNMFFTTKAENQTGTGLGLAIVKNVVRDHGGSVSVSESPDGGARFTVELPAVIRRQESP